ncbi:MAG: sigma-70 family RNA polymerase sigma factor [Oscillospiraceae bacterium]|jgi:RNA polymerase sigma-70 factor (ECF subfamily)|nr:sigma-70 family RNA polymerase sigma factor [Oscillospiraceae bacterium]
MAGGDADRALVERAARGEEAAFEALVNAYQKRVYTLAFRMTHSREDAFDLSQEIFLKVYRALPRFKAESSFSTWLYRLASNVCLDHARKAARRREQPMSAWEQEGESQPVEWPDMRYSPEAVYEKAELREAVAEAMDKLTPEHRIVLTLRDIERLSYAEIAAALELEEGTVKSRLARARAALCRILTAHGNFFENRASKPSSPQTKGRDETSRRR